MPITDLRAYKARRDGFFQRLMLSKASLTAVGARSMSSWLLGGFPAAGATPTTAAVPTNATAGSFGQLDSSGTQRLLRAAVSWGATGGLITIADRLSHQGGLSGTVATAQTTNLPTAALTRKTSGVGVMLGLEIYTQIGTTATTVTASYTNDAGSSGRTTPALTWGGTNNREASRLVITGLQAGDKGVRAVASVTALATTGTAGAFGVTLFYPHVSIPMFGVSTDVEALLGMGSWFAQIETGACLFAVIHTATAATGAISVDLKLGED